MKNWEHVPELAEKVTVASFEAPLMVRLEGGTFLWFDSAFYRYEGDFFVVYSEHAGYHAFPQGSVEEWAGVERF